jgi:hypothetical protein
MNLTLKEKLDLQRQAKIITESQYRKLLKEAEAEPASPEILSFSKMLTATGIPNKVEINPETPTLTGAADGPVKPDIKIKNPNNGQIMYIVADDFNTSDSYGYMLEGPGFEADDELVDQLGYDYISKEEMLTAIKTLYGK